MNAQATDSARSTQALEKLCRAYWYPLYAYVRRRGHAPEDAKDLTQEFFRRLLANQLLASVDRRKGKFRYWLLAVMNHFLAHEWEKARAQKRGGGRMLFSLDEVAAEERYRFEPTELPSAEAVFDRSWALHVLEQALENLRAEFAEAGKESQFTALRGFITGDEAPSSAETARRLGMTEGGAKTTIHRLRRRYQELVREQIAHTVTNVAEIDEEIRHLLAVLRSS